MRQRLPLFCMIVVAIPWVAIGQEDSETTPSGAVVDFQRDIIPILSARCVKCHGDDNAKNDFRVDDRDSVLAYIEAGDVEASSLWTDYLRGDDPDLLMPPADHGGPLSATELALVNVWISEGAHWSGTATFKTAEPEAAKTILTVPTKPLSIAARIWAFQGYLHPATVHFPIALLLVGGLFVVIGVRYPTLGENMAVVCLLLGTVSAIAATVMGWSFAARQGYGSWDRIDLDSEIFWHRWSGVIVTVIAVFVSLFAIAWLRGGGRRSAQTWKIGLVLIAALIGAVGHQGGELTYGKTFYQEAFELLLGTETGDSDPVSFTAPGVGARQGHNHSAGNSPAKPRVSATPDR